MAAAIDSIPNPLAKFLVKYLVSNGIDFRLILVIAGGTLFIYLFGIFSKGLLERRTSIANEKKLKSETTKSDLENNNTINEAKDKLTSSEDTFNLLLRSLIQNVKSGNIKSIDSDREELIRTYTVDLFPSFEKYIDLNKLYLKNKKDHMIFIIGEILPRLKNLLSFLDTVNDNKLLSDIGDKSPFRISKSTLLSIMHYTNCKITFFDFNYTNYRNEFNLLFKDIIFD
jgi:hypothetical protein